MRRWLVLTAVTALIAACGGGNKSPTAPPAPLQISGVWRGTTRLTAVDPVGNCVADNFRPAVGASVPITVAVTQTGGSFTMRVNDDTTGTFCDYSGSISSSGAFTANFTFCSAGRLTNFTVGPGCTRNMEIFTSAFTGNASARQANGTGAESWNTFLLNGATAGVVTFRSTFQLARQ